MRKEQWLAAVVGLAIATSTWWTPAFAQANPTVTVHGCLVPQEDGTLAFRVAGGALGPEGAARLVRGGEGAGEVVQAEGVVCGAFLATQNDDGSWSYRLITASGDGSGQITIDQQSGEWTPPPPPQRPFRNR